MGDLVDVERTRASWREVYTVSMKTATGSVVDRGNVSFGRGSDGERHNVVCGVIAHITGLRVVNDNGDDGRFTSSASNAATHQLTSCAVSLADRVRACSWCAARQSSWGFLRARPAVLVATRSRSR